jgi:hypothetical protein
MKDIIELLITEGYNIHKKETTANGFPTYVLNYNGIRNWAYLVESHFRMCGIPEGTDGETTVYDTGMIIAPSVSFIKGQIDKFKNEENV